MWERVTTKELKARFHKVFLVESQKYEVFGLVEPDYCTYSIYGKDAEYWDLGGVLFGTGVLFTDGAGTKKNRVYFCYGFYSARVGNSYYS